MSSLAATTAARMGAAHIVVANRTADRAGRLAASVGGAVADLADLACRSPRLTWSSPAPARPAW